MRFKKFLDKNGNEVKKFKGDEKTGLFIKCHKCDTVKPITEYTGNCNKCKTCVKNYNQQNYEENKQLFKEKYYKYEKKKNVK